MAPKPLLTEQYKTIEEIYLDAKIVDELTLKQIVHTDKTPVALYRFVEDDAKRMILFPVLEGYKLPNGNWRSPDVERKLIDGTWYVIPKRKTGVSLFNGQRPFSKPGRYYVIPKGTPIPLGLAVTDDNPNQQAGFRHFSITPRTAMAELNYLFLLRRLASWAIPV